ncbi:MAG: hypothetical protein HC867_09470 [Bacteroidia bacterium]|nr:hypothetical protein [Bacteroidia bacterium]
MEPVGLPVWDIILLPRWITGIFHPIAVLIITAGGIHGTVGAATVSTRHYYENVAVFSFSSDAKLEWTNFIRKTQYEDNSDVTLSYQLFNTGGELHFLFNQLERRSLLLNDQSVGPDGQIKRNPTLRNLDKGYEFMPRFGKQTGARQLVIPCMTRNYICFAKLDF